MWQIYFEIVIPARSKVSLLVWLSNIMTLKKLIARKEGKNNYNSVKNKTINRGWKSDNHCVLFVNLDVSKKWKTNLKSLLKTKLQWLSFSSLGKLSLIKIHSFIILANWVNNIFRGIFCSLMGTVHVCTWNLKLSTLRSSLSLSQYRC